MSWVIKTSQTYSVDKDTKGNLTRTIDHIETLLGEVRDLVMGNVSHEITWDDLTNELQSYVDVIKKAQPKERQGRFLASEVNATLQDELDMWNALEHLASLRDLLQEMVKGAALKQTNSFSEESVGKMNELIGVLNHFEGELDFIGDEIEVAKGGSVGEGLENYNPQSPTGDLNDMDSGI
jgi:cysteinyl-tRNA synthetase